MTSTVTCGYSGAAWEINSTGQNACQVYAALAGKCNSAFVIADVVSTSPPYQPQNDACTCNLVAYNLMAGCGWCQSTIQSDWWLTVAQWSAACTTASYDSTGIPSSVSTTGINIPSWATLPNLGTSWSPSAAQAAASPLPSGTGAIFTTPTIGGYTYSYNPYTYSYSYPYDTPYYWDYYYGVGVAAYAIALGVIFGLYALLAITVGVVYYFRQKKRKAWYGPMAAYYRNMGVGGYQGNYSQGGNHPPPGAGYGAPYDKGYPPAGAPLLYNNEPNIPGSPAHQPSTLYGSSPSPGFTSTPYQPPPGQGTNPFNTPYPTPGAEGNPGYQPPPPAGQHTSMYGPPGGQGYTGRAEAY